MGYSLSKYWKMDCKRSNYKCVICDKDAEQLLWPCSHFCLCSKCTSELVKYQQGKDEVKCPICRCISIPIKVFPP